MEDDPEHIARGEPEETPEDIDRNLVVPIKEIPKEDTEDVEDIDITVTNIGDTHQYEDGDIEDEDASEKEANIESEDQHTEADAPADLSAERVDMKPVPTTQRTTIVSQPPDRYGDVMITNVPRPINRKLDAVSALMTSGTLNPMDSETVYKVFAA